MKKPQTRRRILQSLLLLLLVCQLVLIFTLSAQPAGQSDQTSGSLISSVLPLLQKDFSSLPPEVRQQRVEQLQKGVRTLAHMAEFAVLGVLACAFVLTVRQTKAAVALGYLGCVLAGALDEVHQLFVPGRAFQAGDIAIDALGAALGTAAVALLFRFVKNHNNTHQRKEVHHATDLTDSAV